MAEGVIKSIGQVGVVSADPARLIAFYRDVMGFPVLFEANGMTFMRAGATSLMISGGHGPTTVGNDVILYFEPSDWHAAVAKLQSAGVKFEHGEMVVQRDGTREHALQPFKDPEGRPIYLLGWRDAS